MNRRIPKGGENLLPCVKEYTSIFKYCNWKIYVGRVEDYEGQPDALHYLDIVCGDEPSIHLESRCAAELVDALADLARLLSHAQVALAPCVEATNEESR